MIQHNYFCNSSDKTNEIKFNVFIYVCVCMYVCTCARYLQSAIKPVQFPRHPFPKLSPLKTPLNSTHLL